MTVCHCYQTGGMEDNEEKLNETWLREKAQIRICTVCKKKMENYAIPSNYVFLLMVDNHEMNYLLTYASVIPHKM